MPGQSDASKLKHYTSIRNIVKSRERKLKNRYYPERPFKAEDAGALRILPEEHIVNLERLALSDRHDTRITINALSNQGQLFVFSLTRTNFVEYGQTNNTKDNTGDLIKYHHFKAILNFKDPITNVELSYEDEAILNDLEVRQSDQALKYKIGSLTYEVLESFRFAKLRLNGFMRRRKMSNSPVSAPNIGSNMNERSLQQQIYHPSSSIISDIDDELTFVKLRLSSHPCADAFDFSYRVESDKLAHDLTIEKTYGVDFSTTTPILSPMTAASSASSKSSPLPSDGGLDIEINEALDKILEDRINQPCMFQLATEIFDHNQSSCNHPAQLKYYHLWGSKGKKSYERMTKFLLEQIASQSGHTAHGCGVPLKKESIFGQAHSHVTGHSPVSGFSTYGYMPHTSEDYSCRLGGEYERLICFAECGHIVELMRNLKYKNIVYGYAHSGFDYSSAISGFSVRLVESGETMQIGECNSFLDINDKLLLIATAFKKKEYKIRLLIDKHCQQNHPIPLEINGFRGYGMVCLEEQHKTSLEVQKRLLALIINPMKSIQSNGLSFTPDKQLLTSSLASEQLCGGKGYSLIQLARLANNFSDELLNVTSIPFEVPNGVIVTTRAYLLWLRSDPSVREAIVNLDNIVKLLAVKTAISNKYSKDYLSLAQSHKILKEQCQKTKDVIGQSKLPWIIQDTIRNRLVTCFGATCFSEQLYACRSSAVGEDSVETSAAGQMRTILGLRTFDQICKSVVQCWASQFDVTAVAYKSQNGLPINGSMAVVIQSLINGDVAGVATTCEPISGDPHLLIITANYGLGESVVGAIGCQPDTIRVKVKVRSLDGRVSMEEYNDDNVQKIIGNKTIEIKAFDQHSTGGTHLPQSQIASDSLSTSDVNRAITRGDQYGDRLDGTKCIPIQDPARSKACCLSDQQIQQLSKIFLWLKNTLDVQDREIEWSIKIQVPNGQDPSSSSSSSSSSSNLATINEVSNKNEPITRIYLLQSRPLTNLEKLDTYEIDHESDYGVSSPKELLSRANLGEVFPGALSTLSISYFLPVVTLLRPYNKPLEPNHTAVPSTTMNFVSYANVISLVRSYSDSISLHLSGKWLGLIQTMIGFAEINDDEVIKLFKERITPLLKSRGNIHWSVIMALELITGPLNWYTKYKYNSNSNALFKDIDQMSKLINEFELSTNKLISPTEKGKDDLLINATMDDAILNNNNIHDVFQLLASRLEMLSAAWMNHGRTTQASMAMNAIVMSMLSERQEPIEAYSEENIIDFSHLMTKYCRTESSDVSKLLSLIVESIVQEHELCDKFKSFNESEAYNYLDTTSDLCGKLFRDFMEKNGHRSYKEFDIGSFSWSEDPSYILKSICSRVKNYTRRDDESEKKSINRSERKIKARHSKQQEDQQVEKILAKVVKNRTFLSNVILPRARKAVIRREESKSFLILTVHRYRMIFKHLGKLLCLAGKLPSVDLIFHLRFEEIEQLTKKQSVTTKLISKARQRMHRAEILNKLQFTKIDMKFDEFIQLVQQNTMPSPINDEQQQQNLIKAHETNVSASESNTVTGMTSCAGLVVGRACVIDSIEQIVNVQPDDILITYSIDVSWSVYFPMLKGIITEIGGIISHGAVIAREYGLPTLCSASGACKAFETGQIITLDATKGLCYLTPDEGTKNDETNAALE